MGKNGKTIGGNRGKSPVAAAPGSPDPALVPIPSKTAAERLAELLETSIAAVKEAALVFTTPHEPDEVVEVGTDLIDDMSLEELEAELALIGDPHAARIAIGAYRGRLMEAMAKAVQGMQGLIGVAEDAIHKSREPEARLSDRKAALEKAKAEFEKAAAADAERIRSDAQSDRVAEKARKTFGPHVPGSR